MMNGRVAGIARTGMVFLVGYVVLHATAGGAQAGLLPFLTTESGQYLLIARERINGNTDISTNNFELGAMKAPVPSTGSFLNNGSTGGPNLAGNVPNLPANALPVFQGIGGRGNIAVTDFFGSFKLQDVGVYADPEIGIRLAGTQQSLNLSSNAFFNDPMHFPNTFDVNTQTGLFVNPNDADQSTRIDRPDNGGFNTGITFGFDHSDLVSELSDARTAIQSLAGTGSLNVPSGVINTHTQITLSPGLNVIDILSGSNDFLIQNANFVIDGPAGSTAIFRLSGNNNMLVSNANILLGTGGIEPGSVMFYTGQTQNDTHFSFSNTIINGASFWSLGPNGGTITINNAQGCTQLAADIINLNDVRFNTCVFVPEPTTLLLVMLGAASARRRRS